MFSSSGTPKKIGGRGGGGVQATYQNPYPFYDENLCFSLPHLWNKKVTSKIHTHFNTRVQKPHPIYDHNA